MADKKRKVRDEMKQKATKTNKKFNGKSLSNKNKKDDKGKKRKTGPRLPNALRKELDRINPDNQFNGEEDEDILSDEVNDFYEYEEEVAEEESKKNRRYDPVENYEYQLPEKFKDENVQSDDDDDDGNDKNNGDANKFKDSKVKRKNLDQLNNDFQEEDDERHLRMLQGITGMPTEAFEDKKKKKKNFVISEAYPESEYNPTRDILDGDGRITIEDLLGSLQGKPAYSQLRKRTHQMEKKTAPLHAPLSKDVRDMLERKAAYEQSKKDITKWEPLVKRNREAPTIIFDRDTELGFSTVGAIASEFEPRTEFEKKMASLVYDDKVMEAHKEDGARLLELNKISAEDVKDKWNHIAKMRSLLFRHEVKMKRIKKIKSKVYHRMLKKDRLKVSSDEMHMDPEAAKEQAMKQEFKRAEERMTLKHKNRSKWARRILDRGLSVQDEGTKAAIAEQLHQHALLTRKMKSMKESSSDDSSNEEEDEDSAGSDHDGPSKMLTKAKEKTLRVLEEDDEVPNSGVLSLPFMMRGLKKKKEEAAEEAKLALQEYESSLNQLEGAAGLENTKAGTVSGRRVFGASGMQAIEKNNKIKSDNSYANSDSEEELGEREDDDLGLARTKDVQKDVNANSVLLGEDSETRRDSVFKSYDDIVGEAGPKTTYEVSMFVSDTWKKMKSETKVDTNIKRSPKFVEPVKHNQDEKVMGEESDTDSEGQMVDGILSSGARSSYELPSQAELIREAFAGDDVEEEFSKDKEELLDEENPEPEKPVLLPGWGQWTSIQKKKGLPSWMVEEHEIAKKKREDALKKRKDAHLKHVIISEKLDKKAEKLHTKTLPYPFTSKEVFEQSIRMPIGPEFNPATAIGALNRPEVVKKQGLIIKPIKYEDVDPYEREEHKRKSGQTGKPRIKKIQNKLKAVVAKS
ncbi:hypothetical protein JCGZ_13944 [Jatropha curcas]|uniref:Uncharacterized protein n=1 Tax=Jatropha curcas TaxID=180498 RepID=A0A067JZF3_JATCU|nr:uncharacterized protein C57A7.06 [Jatropha curcas]KDP28173.1 hypothetical protein JCGZ_13944 [Jatropha curcas]